MTTLGASTRSGGLCWAGVQTLHRTSPAKGPPLSRSGLLRCYSAPRSRELSDASAELGPPTVPRCAEFGGDYKITLYKDGARKVGISKTGQALTVNSDPNSLIAEWNKDGEKANKRKPPGAGGGFQEGDVVIAKCSKSALVTYGQEPIKPVKAQCTCSNEKGQCTCRKDGLVQQIKELQMLYPEVKQEWYSYCESNRTKKLSPSAHAEKFLTNFITSLPPRQLKKTCVIVRGEEGTIVGRVEPWEDQGWQNRSKFRVDFPKHKNAIVSADDVWQPLPGSKPVTEFDLLVEVNGVRGDVDAMMEELQNADELRLTLRKVPRELGTLRKTNGKLRTKLIQDELDSLDFHGGSGDIQGLRAWLAHRRGCASRGWRKEVAGLNDDAGVKPVTKGEFCMAMANMGFPGQALTLWHALTGGRPSAGLEDLEPTLAEKLDLLCKGLRKRFPGGAAEAWPELERDHMCRATFQEFHHFVLERKMMPTTDKGEQTLWKCFEALDVAGRGNVTLEDLRFLDRWALHRYGVPLPEGYEPEGPLH